MAIFLFLLGHFSLPEEAAKERSGQIQMSEQSGVCLVLGSLFFSIRRGLRSILRTIRVAILLQAMGLLYYEVLFAKLSTAGWSPVLQLVLEFEFVTGEEFCNENVCVEKPWKLVSRLRKQAGNINADTLILPK